MARAPAEGAPTSGSYRLPATGPATPVSRMMKLKTMATAMPTTSGRKASWNLCSVGVTPLDAKQRGNADPDVRHPVRIRSCPLEETLESDDPGAAHGDGPEHHGTHRCGAHTHERCAGAIARGDDRSRCLRSSGDVMTLIYFFYSLVRHLLHGAVDTMATVLLSDPMSA